jgi:hypothetical protein
MAPTASHRHRLVEEKDMVKAKKGHRSSINRLKLVCRQLYAETAGLEIRFNAIVFSPQKLSPFQSSPQLPASEGKYFKAAEQWFLDFVAPMTPNKLQWLSTVIIASGVECLTMIQPKAPPMPDLPSLAMFCKQHPHIDIRYQFPNFGFDCDIYPSSLNFLSAGVCLVTALKGDRAGAKARDALLNTNTWVQIGYEEAQHWREVWNIQYLFKDIKNFTIMPTAHMDPSLLTLRGDAENLHITETQWIEWQLYASAWLQHGISGA